MIIKLNFLSKKQKLNYNYKYDVNAWIYSIIEEFNPKLANELHNGLIKDKSNRYFKPFVFSDLSFQTQKNLKNFKTVDGIGSLFLASTNQEIIDIFTKLTYRDIKIKNINLTFLNTEIVSIESNVNYFYSKSPILVKETIGKLQKFLCPTDKEFVEKLKINLVKKYFQITRKEIDINSFQLNIIDFSEPVLEKYKEERFYKGYYCTIELYAPTELKEIILNLGLGIYNCQGFGMMLPFEDLIM